MEALCAEVVQIDGNYDDSVHLAAQEAEAFGWNIISDTSYEGYMDIPRYILAGYTVMAEEILDQIGQDILTHVFLQGGVGGLASAVAGKPSAVNVTEETMMAGLSCGEVSLLSWSILEQATDDFMTISDSSVRHMMRVLNRGSYGDIKIIAGESAVAGLAALDMVKDKPEAMSALGLGSDSHVLIIGTEGATDPEIYDRIMRED